jgi:hypothetical protein
VAWKPGLLLIKINGEEIEVHGSAPPQILKKRKHGEAVFAAAQADQHAIALCDHAEVGDCLPCTSQQYLPRFLPRVHFASFSARGEILSSPQRIDDLRLKGAVACGDFNRQS